ncbi:MAG: L,D-transpeptidase [Armatimonadota bacterium]|nr:L,D-transpeptidase [bacterium]
MKYFTVPFILLALTMSPALSQGIRITGPDRSVLLEGTAYDITWAADSPLKDVSVIAYGIRTPLGDTSRGDFNIPISSSLAEGATSVNWTVPWIDAITFFVKVAGQTADGKQSTGIRAYGFRPYVLRNRTKDGIYLDLHLKKNQRLYVQRGGRITNVFISSSSAEYRWLSRNRHLNAPHDHAGVFSILEKKPLHHSRLFDVDMPWAMRYHGGHFIHATPPENYEYLGEPASSGCNRMTYVDAYKLYHMTPVGTRVEIIGPGG